MRGESLTQTIGIHNNEQEMPAESDLQYNQNENKRHSVWTRGENLTQTNDKKCPTVGKGSPCITSSQPATQVCKPAL
jgi:hypothetical protein